MDLILSSLQHTISYVPVSWACLLQRKLIWTQWNNSKVGWALICKNCWLLDFFLTMALSTQPNINTWQRRNQHQIVLRDVAQGFVYTWTMQLSRLTLNYSRTFSRSKQVESRIPSGPWWNLTRKTNASPPGLSNGWWSSHSETTRNAVKTWMIGSSYRFSGLRRSYTAHVNL